MFTLGTPRPKKFTVVLKASEVSVHVLHVIALDSGAALIAAEEKVKKLGAASLGALAIFRGHHDNLAKRV